MKTGFYNLNSLSTKQLKSFFTDAIMLSYDTHVEILSDESIRRHRSFERTIGQMIDDCNTSYHNVCIDRSVSLGVSNYGEIGYCTLGNPDYFLYIFVTLENLQILVNKYHLEEKE